MVFLMRKPNTYVLNTCPFIYKDAFLAYVQHCHPYTKKKKRQDSSN